MALQSGFFNSVNDDRAKNADFFSRYFASFIGNGVFPNPSDNFQVTANDDMTIIITKGSAWINGTFCFDDFNYIATLDVADGVLDRIDRVVLRLDVIDREIKVLIKKGVFASSPTAPILQRDADAYELGLADIKVAKGAISITQANVTDLRLNTELCGVVHGVVNQVDTTTLFNQYQDWFKRVTEGTEQELEDWEMATKEEFENWFESIKDILEGDVAANLASRIVILETEFESFKEDVKNHIIIRTNINIISENWIDKTEEIEYWIYEIADIDVDENTVVDVNIHLEDLEKAEGIKSATMSSKGKVTIYADKQLDEDILCDLKLVRQVI